MSCQIKLIEMKEDLSAEITDLTRKQLYQSSWNLAGTLKHKVCFNKNLKLKIPYLDQTL